MKKSKVFQGIAWLVSAVLLLLMTGCGSGEDVSWAFSDLVPSDGSVSEAPETKEQASKSPETDRETEPSAETEPRTEEETKPQAEEAPKIPENVPVSEGLSYRDNGNGTCTVTGPGTWTGEHLRIGEKIDGLTVTEIGANAFRDNATLKSVTCPKTLVCIRQAAFCYSPNLTNVSLNDGLEWIGDSVFASTGLWEMVFPDTVTKTGSYTFVSCKNLRKVVIPDGVKQIGQNFCLGCEKLTGLVLPANTEEIWGDAFFQCKSLTEVTLPDKVWRVDYYAFGECTNLKTLHLSKALSQFDGDAIAGSSAIETLTIPENETYYIKGNCLIQKKDGVVAAGICTSVIPDDGSVTAIGRNAFSYRREMTELKIPSSVTKIDYEAFKGCEKLKKIEFSEGLVSIGEQAFRDCYSLTELVLPESLTELGPSAFRYCETLKTVKCGNNIRKYSDQAFRECYELIEADLGEGAEELGEYLFWRCLKLKKLTFGKNVKSIRSNFVMECKSLTDIYYGGTKAEWNLLRQGAFSTETFTVHCTDGDVTK